LGEVLSGSVQERRQQMSNVQVVALDIHKKFSKAVIMEKESEILGERVIYHGDKSEMAAFLGKFEAGTDVVMEATFNWPWIADSALEAGLKAHLVDPVRAREMSKGYAKTDRKDAIYLGNLFLCGTLFPEVYLAPVEVRDKRWLFRLRLTFVRMRVALKNAVHGQLFRLGYVADFNVFSEYGREILEKHAFGELERMLLERKFDAIDHLSKQIGLLEQRIAGDLREDRRAGILMSLPGVGKITAYGMLAEIGEIKRFASPRALSAYAGLLPLDNESGGTQKPKHTGGRCNRHLRWTAIEAVGGALKCSERMRSLHARVSAKNKGMGGKARVAVAREIVELAWILLTRNEHYREERPQRPGSAKRAESIDPNRASQSAPCARS
jgi:transposase